MHRHLCAVILGIGSLGVGVTSISCGDRTVEDRSQVGRLTMTLGATSSSGAKYRLREAMFRITGASSAEVSSETDPEADSLSVELKAGGYLIRLANGWTIERQTSDGAFEPVRAVLISPNPVPFTIEDQRTTSVQFRFKAGNDVVQVGNGRVVVGIDVQDDGGVNGQPDGGVGNLDGAAGCPSGYHIISDGRCKPILFSDDFGDGILPGEWLLWRKTFVETEGRVQVGDMPREGFDYGHAGSGRGAIIATHVGDGSWTDYRVDLDVQVSPAGAYNPFGLTDCTRVLELRFRIQDDHESWNEPASTFYTLGINAYGADCDGRTPQSVTLGSLHGFYLSGTGCCNQVGFSRSLVETVSPAISDGPNHYTIEVVGSNIKLWVNDAPVLDYTDDKVPYDPPSAPIRHGGFGISWLWEDLGWADNVVVTDMR